MMDRHRLPRLLRGSVTSLAPPGVVTLGALLPIDVSTATAALCYVLAVVVAAAAGGLVAGLVASVCSFLALNFFFTPPFHTFAVEGTADLVALAVFLAVSATVGTMFSRALEQRSRAERREREARLLHHLGTRLRSGVPTEDVLRSLARSILELFDLERCEITSELAHGPIVAERPEGGTPAGPEEFIPITVQDRELGSIVVVTDGTRPAMTSEERGVIQTLASQIALAIDGMRLGSEAEEARMEAETNRLRAALFSSVTHDLRTPLASITASVSSLLEDNSPLQGAQRRELLETIDQETGRLNRVIGNLMDLSRMRAGAVVPTKTLAGIDELIESVLARSGPILEEHDIRLMLRDGSSRDPRRRGPDRSGAHEHRRERGAVHAEGETDHGGGGSVARRRAGADRGSRARDPSGGTRARLRALRPRRGEHGYWPRPGHRARDRGRPRRLDRRRGRTRRWDGGRHRASRGIAMTEARVLVVDDDPQILRAVRTSLQGHSYDVLTAGNGETALDLLPDAAVDLIVLDLGLPGIGGHEVIRRVRSWSDVPIIVLSVRDGQQDKVEAFEAGADDYVTKPFGMPELLARMRAVRRRADGERRPPVVRFGDLEVDLGRQLVRLEQTAIHLTPTEYRLLEAFATNPGKLLTHRWLLQKAWGPGYSTEHQYLRVFIRQLRKKLSDDPARPRFIVTEAGLGYRWKPDADEDRSASSP